MRVLIVDDERPARDKLRRLLAFETDVDAIDEAHDASAAIAAIAAFKPDLLLLDIDMPGMSGLALAASLPSPAPLIVFVTAHDAHAIEAFDADAVDYLLKPYGQQRLQRALARVRSRMGARAQALAGVAPQLLVSDRGVTHVVKLAQLQWIETADNYVVLHTESGQLLMRQTLAGLLDTLGPGFARCHRRAAVQLDWISAVQSLDKGDAELLLRGGARVPCSRQYRAAIVALI